MKSHFKVQIRGMFIKSLMSFLLVASGSILTIVSAQTAFKTTSAEVSVNGKSNIHDWDMKTEAGNANALMTMTNGELTGIKSLDFIMLVKSMKSGQSIMDTRAQKALKADAHPNITYKLTTATVTSTAKGKYTIKTEGNLTISGVTKPVSMTVNGVSNSDGSIQITGKRKMKMSEFKIPPPSYMLGAMKVYDDLEITFNLKLK